MKKVFALVLVLCICLLPVSALAGDYNFGDDHFPWESQEGRSFYPLWRVEQFIAEELGGTYSVKVIFSSACTRIELTGGGHSWSALPSESDFVFRGEEILISQEIITLLVVSAGN